MKIRRLSYPIILGIFIAASIVALTPPTVAHAQCGLPGQPACPPQKKKNPTSPPASTFTPTPTTEVAAVVPLFTTATPGAHVGQNNAGANPNVEYGAILALAAVLLGLVFSFARGGLSSAISTNNKPGRGSSDPPKPPHDSI